LLKNGKGTEVGGREARGSFMVVEAGMDARGWKLETGMDTSHQTVLFHPASSIQHQAS
jgi:hypothetical protein